LIDEIAEKRFDGHCDLSSTVEVRKPEQEFFWAEFEK